MYLFTSTRHGVPARELERQLGVTYKCAWRIAHELMGESMWSSLDAGWTSAHETYAGRLRTGYRLFDDVSLGIEARVNGNALDKDARGGVFIRYAWHGGEISLAGGLAGRFFEDANDMHDPYATLCWLQQF
jgi:hypothetical protein